MTRGRVRSSSEYVKTCCHHHSDQMTEYSKPALRISNVVYGRVHDGNRVRYLLDPSGTGEDREIPEEIVLRRWRKRKLAGFLFSGGRLAPSVWRALPKALGADVAEWCKMSEAKIDELLLAARASLNEQMLTAPSAGTVMALIEACGASRLQQLVARHAEEHRWPSPGVPDLFLFARGANGSFVSRFVEVKRPRERLLPSQEQELDFLIEQGLSARVLRLSERA